jgi:cytoskeletal protein CcmA (bactofilin family)
MPIHARKPLMRISFREIALLILIGVGATTPLSAQDNERSHVFTGMVFDAGREVRIVEPVAKDLFAAGETVTIDSEVRETAHAAGRDVRVNRAVGNSLYAAGYDVGINAPVGRDVIAAGYQVEIGSTASVGQDVLAAGRSIIVSGPVTGDVILTGQTVEIDSTISGSAEIRASQIRFGNGARIAGTFAYWSDGRVDVPPSVVAPERVTAHIIERAAPSPRGLIAALIAGSIAFLIAAIFLMAVFVMALRRHLSATRETLFAHPWQTLLFGVIATSALFGCIVVFAVSLVGIPLIPVVIVLVPFLIFGGYLTTAYAVGSGLLRQARVTSDSGLVAFGAVVLGVVALVLIGTIPIFGWVVAVIAVTVGLGSWYRYLLARRAPTATV